MSYGYTHESKDALKLCKRNQGNVYYEIWNISRKGNAKTATWLKVINYFNVLPTDTGMRSAYLQLLSGKVQLLDVLQYLIYRSTVFSFCFFTFKKKKIQTTWGMVQRRDVTKIHVESKWTNWDNHLWFAEKYKTK